MGKLIAWLILIFIVLLALRLINQRKSRRQQRAADAAGSTAVEPMVRCTRCGVFLPRADATQRAGEYACPDGQCVKR
jgi:Flp pilus assembly protein TadB